MASRPDRVSRAPATARTSRCWRALAGWGVVAVVALALVGGGAAAQDDPRELTREQALRGNQLYQAQCARCHGASGTGQSGVAPSLHEVDVAYVDLVLRTGRMPPGDPDGQSKGNVRLSDEDREALVGWVAEEFALEGQIPTPPQGDPARGHQVYSTNCAQCHQYTGSGGVAGAGAYTPKVSGLDPVTVAEAIRIGPFEMPRFGPDQISYEEMGDVAAYLELVGAEQGTPLDVFELDPAYAAAFVALLALGVLVSLMWLAGRVTMFPDVSGEAPGEDDDAGSAPHPAPPDEQPPEVER